MKKQKPSAWDDQDLVEVLNELIGLGIKRAKIAEEIGVDTDSISRYLDGSRKRISFTTGCALMRMRERVYQTFADHEQAKREWADRNPRATPEQYQAAMVRIAARMKP